MQNTHEFQKRSAEAREFRDQQDILWLHSRKECAKFAVGEFFSGTNGFLVAPQLIVVTSTIA
jgi:hypothetical protein